MGWNPEAASGISGPDVAAPAPPVPEPSDGEAIARSLHDPDAFVLVFERHFDILCGYLSRRVGRTIGEELAAETFTRAFAKRDRYSADYADARPWLFGIALNLLRTHARKERRELRAYARAGVDPLAREGDEADAGLGARELAGALARLSAKDREILLLFVWADLPYEAIAQALDLPVGTVRSRLSRARGRLRELLEGSGELRARPMPTVATDEGVR